MFTASDNRFLQEDKLTPSLLEKVGKLSKVALQRGQTLAEMALAWELRDPVVASVLVGASKPEQIINNIGVLANTSFTEEELTEIDRICAEE